jgi:hypothetical protein
VRCGAGETSASHASLRTERRRAVGAGDLDDGRVPAVEQHKGRADKVQRPLGGDAISAVAEARFTPRNRVTAVPRNGALGSAKYFQVFFNGS